MSSASTSSKDIFFYLLAAALALAALLRAAYAGARELWYDEVLSLLLSTTQRSGYVTPPDTPVALADYQPLLQLPPDLNWVAGIKPLLQGIVGQEPHPPLFFLGQYAWLPLAGNGEAALRSLNLGLSLVAIVAAYGLGRRLFHHRGGLILAALLGLNPFYWFHSLNLRMFGPAVTWIALSGWALLEVVDRRPGQRRRWWWSLVLVGAIAAGMLTYYLSLLWFITLGIVALVLDRRSWRRYVLCALGAALLSAPWFYWGLPQQLRNADFERFSAATTWLETAAQHLQGLLQVLGIQLLLGDWATDLPDWVAIAAGSVIALALIVLASQLWQRYPPQQAALFLLIGLLPLLLLLGLDVLSGKSTLGWGFGRSAIFVLPGLLTMMTAWIVGLHPSRQQAVVACVLALYLTSILGDMALRQRQVFHQVAQAIDRPSTTLVAVNSNAWGHVLRLAYYLPSETWLLATAPTDLPAALDKQLSGDGPYSQILWLEAANPVWGKTTPSETRQLRQTVETELGRSYRLVEQQQLAGTMELDRFRLTRWQRP